MKDVHECVTKLGIIKEIKYCKMAAGLKEKKIYLGVNRSFISPSKICNALSWVLSE